MKSDVQGTNLAADILIVDDTPDSLRLLYHMLAERGHAPRMVTNGREALEAVQIAVPDLILLDIMMPEMNGFEVCRHLKADPQTQDIPIIFISAIEATDDKINAFAAGGVDYITKPFHFKEVIARVEAHLTIRRLQRQVERANRELEQRIAELQTRNEELAAYDHTVAHDLKAPLSTIISGVDVLEEIWDTTPPEALKEYFQIIRRNAHRMNNIIEELMILSGLRQAQEVTIQPLDMSSIVSAALDRLVELIRDRQAQIVTPDQWPVAVGYGPWIEEVWVNYISNAIKYGGETPHVVLGATMESDTEIRFWVRDNGPGISPEDRERLFTPFERLSQVRAQGYGLGLSIVRRIVEKLGRKVEVESEPGNGSVFSFTLPAWSGGGNQTPVAINRK